MDDDGGRMDGVGIGGVGGVAAGRDLGRGEFQSQPIGTRGQMDQGFPMRVTDQPAGRGKMVLMVKDGDGAVHDLLVRVSDLAVDQQDLLVHLGPLQRRTREGQEPGGGGGARGDATYP